MRIISLISIFLLFSCSTMLLDKKKYNYEELQNERSFIHIDLNEQKLYYQDGNRVIDFPISSSSYGIGSEENSYKTPLGLHEISEKIGNDLPLGAVMKGRVWNQEIIEPIIEDIDIEEDVITSRIMWLDGLEPGKNKGNGIDSKTRYIYIHGTAEEGLIGKPASLGCIRMINKDVIRLFDMVGVGTKVLIYSQS